MANQVKLGTDYFLEIDQTTVVSSNTRGTEANYKLVACAVSNGFEIAIASTDTSNKCDGGWGSSISGQGSWSFSIDGQAVTVDGGATAQENYQSVLKIALDKKQFFARITNAASTEVREGLVMITAYSETLPNADVYTFTATLTGIGKPFIEPAA